MKRVHTVKRQRAERLRLQAIIYRQISEEQRRHGTLGQTRAWMILAGAGAGAVLASAQAMLFGLVSG